MVEADRELAVKTVCINQIPKMNFSCRKNVFEAIDGRVLKLKLLLKELQLEFFSLFCITVGMVLTYSNPVQCGRAV